MGAIAVAIGLLGRANATAVFTGVVALFGALVSVGLGLFRRVRGTRTPPSAG